MSDGRVQKTLERAHAVLTFDPNLAIVDALAQGGWEARSPRHSGADLADAASDLLKRVIDLSEYDDDLLAWQAATPAAQVLAALEKAGQADDGGNVVEDARERVRAFLNARRPLAATDGKARDIIISVATMDGPLHLTISDLETILNAGQGARTLLEK